MNQPKLTYVLTTYNKLFFLQMVLEDLIIHCADDEDIVIVDGGSTDGTVEYLSSIQDCPKISKVVSAKDRGEAHGFNKAILLAKGDLIKVITDDDVFHWQSVRSCKEFMSSHPDVDLMGSSGAAINLDADDIFVPLDYLENFSAWKSSNIPFAFCGLGLMIRRESLPLLGLFDLKYVRVDAEYSLRATSNDVNLAWLATPSWVRITNGASNSVKYFDKCVEEENKLNYLYFNKLSIVNKFKSRIKKSLRPILKTKNLSMLALNENEKIKNTFRLSRAWLDKNSRPESNESILRK
jgi:glycosyltransferase involved in cell wall biosynthesis